MIEGGKGGCRTKTGLRFEKRADLKAVFKKLLNYSVQGNTVFYKGKKVAELFGKNNLYKHFLEPKGVHYTKIISKKLLPDNAVFVLSKRMLFIIEIKFQKVQGSVDEKLQTCDFKNKQYQKLLKPLGVKAKYAYVLNGWFKKKEYADVLAYIKSVGCDYFFNEIPCSYLGLP